MPTYCIILKEENEIIILQPKQNIWLVISLEGNG